MSGGHGSVDHQSHKGVALLISVLALVLAICETLGKSAQTTAISANVEASNLWSFFQAKTIRQTVMRTAAEEALAEYGDKAPEALQKQVKKWRDTADRYQSEPETGEGRKELMAKAKAAEQKRDVSLAAYHRFEVGSAAVQIAIVLASASIITTMPVLLWISAVLGVVGVACGVLGFAYPTWVPAFLG